MEDCATIKSYRFLSLKWNTFKRNLKKSFDARIRTLLTVILTKVRGQRGTGIPPRVTLVKRLIHLCLVSRWAPFPSSGLMLGRELRIISSDQHFWMERAECLAYEHNTWPRFGPIHATEECFIRITCSGYTVYSTGQ